jgi:hypothetical protein
MIMLGLLLLLLVPAALAADAGVVVSSGDSLLAALRDQTIGALVIDKDIRLTSSAALLLQINR